MIVKSVKHSKLEGRPNDLASSTKYWCMHSDGTSPRISLHRCISSCKFIASKARLSHGAHDHVKFVKVISPLGYMLLLAFVMQWTLMMQGICRNVPHPKKKKKDRLLFVH